MLQCYLTSSKVIGARMFLMASPSLQLPHFFIGLFVFISGLGLSYWGTKKAPGKHYSVKFIRFGMNKLNLNMNFNPPNLTTLTPSLGLARGHTGSRCRWAVSTCAT